MIELDTREWLLTNGLGSFASGTVADVRTRTYHGWFIVATHPPRGRTLLLSHIEASLEMQGQVMALGTNIWAGGQIQPTGYKRLRSFDINPVPKWVWAEENWQITRQLLMPHRGMGNGEWGMGNGGKNPVPHSPLPTHHSPFPQSILIHYRYDGTDAATLRLRLLIADRDLHDQQLEKEELKFSQLLGQQQVCLQAVNAGQFATPWHLRWTHGDYQGEAFWYKNYGLPEETQRGLSDREDLYSPGYLTVVMQPGDAVTLEARLGLSDPQQPSLTTETFAEALEASTSRLAEIFSWDRGVGEGGSGGERNTLISPHPPLPTPHSPLPSLLQASDRFIVYRESIGSTSAIAGYHWFNERARDILIALPGLALTPKRFDLAKGLLRTFGSDCRNGLIANVFTDTGERAIYNSIDAALWWIEALGLYLEATKDWAFLVEQYPMVRQIYKAFIGGTRYNIQVDSTDGLLGWDAPKAALTWMDAQVYGRPVTPRRGKPVEVNALWYSALCWASRWAEILSEQETADSSRRLAQQSQRYTQQAQQVKISLQKFWNPDLGYLYDTIEPDDRRNSQIRPNAAIALSLRHCAFGQALGRAVLQRVKASLLTPYGLRSLDPTDPEYVGKYIGASIQRDRAYHQGTVWAWLIGPFVRAWWRFNPEEPLPFDWQPLLKHFESEACLGSISEIFDGDPPHTPRGAIAQAWSVAEVIRHINY